MTAGSDGAARPEPPRSADRESRGGRAPSPQPRAAGVLGRVLIGTLVWTIGAVAVSRPPGTAWAVELPADYLAVRQAFLREDFARAADLARTFLAAHPEAAEVPRVWLWFALSLDRLDRVGESLRALAALKARLPAEDALWPETVFWEADVSRRAFQMLRAKTAYEELIRRHPKSSWASQARLGLGRVFLHQQDFRAAAEHFHGVAAAHAYGRAFEAYVRSANDSAPPLPGARSTTTAGSGHAPARCQTGPSAIATSTVRRGTRNASSGP